MKEPRQRPIPLTSQERAFLDEQKARYEKSTGDKGDWGKFLGTVTLLGLAAAGIYALAKSTERTRQSLNVQCICKKEFIMAVSGQGEGDLAVYTTCPYCQGELVVYRGRRQRIPETGGVS